jgi:NAD dependent epimerase/dehydratase family enzyme
MAIHRPSWLRVPKFALKPIFGERTEELLLSSQRVIPSRLIEKGYDFQYKQLNNALTNLIKT